MSSYPVVVFASRSINGTASAAELATALAADFATANAVYANSAREKSIAHAKKWAATYLERDIEAAKRYAEGKWKTDKHRAEYIAEATIEGEKKAAARVAGAENAVYSFDYFDVDFYPHDICGKVPVDTKKSVDELTKLFEYWKSKNVPYLNDVKGWELCSETHEETGTYAFRPWIKLIFEPEVEAEYVNAGRKLAAAVNDFYKDTKYWGE